ncbi:putative superoxide dismutase protein [Rosellinia necatrix]|uniref:Putative superoxide dismutase protein n=1 Tax=Rosellinia necatrix TaxID=77044 RepID=A0A1W2TD71_ROSNE|nr:putative superoxide dismutase protein [Rosellinia necatrix]
MLRPRLRIPRAGALLRRTAPFARSQHTVPILDQFRQENAVPGLLSPTGYSTAWTEYMQFLIQKLNYMTVGTDFEHQTPLTILKDAARDPTKAAIFNFASMAHNNHFFFNQLVNLQTLYEQKAGESQARASGAAAQQDGGVLASATTAEAPEPQVMLDASENRIPPKLKQELERHFSSIETLRREFLSTGMGMFGPGFVWLVKNGNTQELRILTTYLAGSPYTAAHWRRQSVDWSTSSADKGTVGSFFDRTEAGAGNGGGIFNSQAPGGTDVIPLLCLNTWEHVWLMDYGIAGKGQYIMQWWETIDWDKVQNLAFASRRDMFK